MLQGAMTAMVTPFQGDAVDFDRLKANVEEQIAAGIDALVPVGTTGESPTLSHDEHRRVVEAVVDAAAGRTKVIAGTGSNATAEALELTRHARRVGADAALVVNPYYNKPTQEGLYRHFVAVAEVGLPVVLYNIPGRTAVALSVDTIVRLAEHPNIVAVKEATGSLDVASEIASRCPAEQLAILSGDDSLTLPLVSVGGRGVISVVANLLPQRVKALVEAALAGRLDDARRMHLELFPLLKGCLTLATNPIPIKTALALAGRDTGELRLPLCPMADEQVDQLRAILASFQLLDG